MVISRKEISRVVGFAVATIVVVLGALFVGDQSVHHILRAVADGKTTAWSRFVVQNVDSLPQIMDGTEEMSEGTKAFLRRNTPMSVLQFKFFDTDGRLRFDSKNGDGGVPSDSDQSRNQDVLRVLSLYALAPEVRSSSWSVREDPEENLFIAGALQPIVQNSALLGAIEVQTDETFTWVALREQFNALAIEIVSLVIVAFGVPGLLYMRRSGQMDFLKDSLSKSNRVDDLTGILNRATFVKITGDRIKEAELDEVKIAVHLMDLDRFKDINDRYGHAFGDAVLKVTAEKIRSRLSENDLFARFGADEFAICQLASDTDGKSVAQLAQSVVAAFDEPLVVQGIEVQVGLSVGYAVSPEDGQSVSELLRATDIALYSAKLRQKGEAIAFDPMMEKERQERQSIEQRLRDAMTNDEFEVNFQPICDTQTEEVCGFEALLRLKDVKGNAISPEVFIPVAEEAGLIEDMGRWVLRESCRLAKDWPETCRVSVNLSPAQFSKGNVPELVSEVLRDTGLDARRLELEVTESLFIDDTNRILKDLVEVKALGVTVALDDFGTGYSSLSYLWQFPFDKLKVDKSFMSELTLTGSKSREILATIVALGKVLDLKITAEGVENQGQVQVLKDMKCDLIQGFYYGRPIANADIPAFLAGTLEGVHNHVPMRAKKKQGAAA